MRDAIQRLALDNKHYGYRRISAQLRREGWPVNHKRVLRIMREDNLLCLRTRPFVPVTTDSRHPWKVVPNLARDMILSGIDQLWVADLTYVATWSGWVYVAFVMDVYSRRIVAPLAAVKVTGKLGMAGPHPMVEHFRFVKENVGRGSVAKMTIPGPSMLHYRGGRKMINAGVYPDMEEYYHDLGHAYAGAVGAFFNGKEFVTPVCVVADPWTVWFVAVIVPVVTPLVDSVPPPTPRISAPDVVGVIAGFARQVAVVEVAATPKAHTHQPWRRRARMWQP